jgi:dehydrogenase/reductase SDR family protein 4
MEKIVLIGGGSRGIGYAMAQKFATDKQTTVIITARKLDQLKKAAEEIKKSTGNENIHYFQCNFTNTKEIQKLADDVKAKWGRVDVLVNNVALSLHFGETLETPESKYDKMMVGNIKSYFFTIQTFLKLIPKKPTSSIILISSYLGIVPEPSIGIYSVTKTALNSLTVVLSRELLDTGIRVNCIAPGLIKTDFSQMLWENGSPKKVGMPEDVAELVYFVCSDKAKFINGAIIPITGEPIASL